MRRFLLFVLILLALASVLFAFFTSCSPFNGSVTGSWKSDSSSVLALTSDGDFEYVSNKLDASGDWTMNFTTVKCHYYSVTGESWLEFNYDVFSNTLKGDGQVFTKL